jgi:hypothetical protein
LRRSPLTRRHEGLAAADEFRRITGRAIDVRDVALIVSISENMPRVKE